MDEQNVTQQEIAWLQTQITLLSQTQSTLEAIIESLENRLRSLSQPELFRDGNAQ